MSAESDYDSAPSRGVSVLGIISLVFGILGTFISLIPCVGTVIGLPLAGMGLLLGVIALIVSLVGKQSRMGFPIAGSAVSLLGLCIAGAWIAVTALMVKDGAKQAQARIEQVEKEDRAIREGPATTVTAEQLEKQYEANEIAAEGKFNGKVLVLTGAVKRVSRTEEGVTVELKASEDGDTVDCQFVGVAEQAKLGDLAEGQRVTIRGKCKGKVRETIALERCMLVK